MRKAFAKGGQAAINKVMKQQPAIFLKMLVLLVPRELQVEHSGSVKEMTDQQIEDAIAAIKQMIAEAGKKPLKRL
jgi:galactose-1-phosphate uridylyltransferase